MPRKPADTAEQAARSFQDLFHARHSDEDIPEIMRELAGTSDRAACIIISAVIERDLERALVRRLTMGFPEIKARFDKLFDMNGPLSGFSGNINLAFALHMLQPETKKDLDTVRRIRNLFAHSAIPVSFKSQQVKDEINKLRAARYYGLLFDDVALQKLEDDRREYILSCLQILVDLEVSLVITNELIDFLSKATSTALVKLRS